MLRHARRLWLLHGLIGAVQTIKVLGARALGLPTIQLTLRRAVLPHAVQLRPCSNDLLVLWSMFGNKECEVKLTSMPSVIIDGGAHIGFAAIQFAVQFPEATVLAVEPDAENQVLLASNCEQYANIEIVKGAIWNEQTTGVIGNPDSDYWARHFSPDASAPNAVTVTARTIDSILAERGLTSADIVKLDIEGAERRVICDSNARWLATANAVIVEIHDSPDVSVICQRMSGAGYSHRRQAEKHIFERVGTGESRIVNAASN